MFLNIFQMPPNIQCYPAYIHRHRLRCSPRANVSCQCKPRAASVSRSSSSPVEAEVFEITNLFIYLFTYLLYTYFMFYVYSTIEDGLLHLLETRNYFKQFFVGIRTNLTGGSTRNSEHADGSRRQSVVARVSATLSEKLHVVFFGNGVQLRLIPAFSARGPCSSNSSNPW